MSPFTFTGMRIPVAESPLARCRNSSGGFPALCVWLPQALERFIKEDGIEQVCHLCVSETRLGFDVDLRGEGAVAAGPIRRR